MSDEIIKIITHKYEDGSLLYLVEFSKGETGEILKDWVDAPTVHKNFENYLDYWERQSIRKTPFSDECEHITIESYDTSKDNKKNFVYAVHMEGNGLDEYHLLSKKQMLEIPYGQRKINNFNEKVTLGIVHDYEEEFDYEENIDYGD